MIDLFKSVALAPESDSDTSLQELLVLMAELIAVIEDENRALGRGIPACLSAFTQRKHELADEFERWTAAVAMQQVAMQGVDDKLLERFFASLKRLRSATDENHERLRAAIEASRRRIDAVMRAIRIEFASTSPYGADGCVSAPRSRQIPGRDGIRV